MNDEAERPASSGYYHYSYESSRVFSSMKRVDERIQKNWGTEQYLNALDTLIAHMMEPIIRSSNYLDYMVASILAWHSDAAQHKITAYDRIEAINYMMTFLTRTDPDEKVKVYRRTRFDRNISLLLADQWLSAVDGYRALCELQINNPEVATTLHEIHQRVGHTREHASLYAAVRAVKFWRSHVLELRQQIVEKYYRLIINEAKSFYELVQHSVSLDDTIQAMFIEASKALDKCNQERGTITSYLQRMLRFSRTKLNTEKDTAFSIRGTSRNGDYSYKAISLEDVENSEAAAFDATDTQDTVNHVRKLARLLDPTGLGRHSLGIEEWLPAIRQQQRH
jgi:hypothetical protein